MKNDVIRALTVAELVVQLAEYPPEAIPRIGGCQVSLVTTVDGLPVLRLMGDTPARLELADALLDDDEDYILPSRENLACERCNGSEGRAVLLIDRGRDGLEVLLDGETICTFAPRFRDTATALVASLENASTDADVVDAFGQFAEDATDDLD